ncbi:DUF6711 family protein [Cohnella sp. GCM10020058]|uniref:DUF6711 family protein n=1 Tax=Cohnella sp. GCM10020058 TaxID=3317330 RepID=UPI003634C9E6
MQILINGQQIAVYPLEYRPTILDLDDGDSTTRTADGKLNRDRVAVKRQIEMTFSAMPAPKMAQLLKSMRSVFFSVTYFDPMDGALATKEMYVGNRTTPMAFEKNGVTWWESMQITLTER